MAQDHTVYENRVDEKSHQEPSCLDLNPGPSPIKPTKSVTIGRPLPTFPCLYYVYLNSPCIVAVYQRVNQIIQGHAQELTHSNCSTVLVAKSGALVFGFVVEVFCFALLFLTKLPFVSLGRG